MENKYSIPRPELLVPAGDLEKLQTAVRFGADAVYVGAGDFSLRAAVSSFTLSDLQIGVRFAHEHGCKVYLALNIFAFDEDVPQMLEYFKTAVEYGIDAVIVSDPGVVALIKEQSTNVKIHISTQANTTNSETVKFWYNNGATRIVLARELSLDQIKVIKEKCPYIQVEIFVHGAMCMSYSGRCLLSKHMVNRSANRGECAQPCRWEYVMRESARSDEMTIEEDARGTYILNSRDLCLIEKIPELVNAGIDSFKVEGRMKTVYYVALVTKMYRQVIDTYCSDPQHYQYLPQWREELEKVSHRFYTSGFYFQNEPLEYTAESAYVRGYDFVGMVSSFDPTTRVLTIQGRNRFAVGDQLEIIDPHEQEIRTIDIHKLRRDNGELVTEAHNDYIVSLPLNETYESISPNSILRKKR